mgnify:CR=1 FL=1
MKKYITVPVDISTIRKVVHIYDVHMRITSVKEIEHPSFILIMVNTINDESDYTYELRFRNINIPDGLQEIINNKDLIKSISSSTSYKETSYKDIDFDSNKDYEYLHQDIEVKCNYCKDKFNISELTDYCSDDDQTYETNICPHCDMPNCVDLEYEKITDKKIVEMIEKGIINIKI